MKENIAKLFSFLSAFLWDMCLSLYSWIDCAVWASLWILALVPASIGFRAASDMGILPNVNDW